MTRKLYRNTENGMLTGVAAGLSDYFGLDASLWRLAILALVVLTGGFFIFVYAAAWIIIPKKMKGEPYREAEYTEVDHDR